MMTEHTFAVFLARNDYPAGRLLPDGRYVALMPLLLGRWRVIVGRGEIEYEDGFCFDDYAQAVRLYRVWDGTSEPPEGSGWTRHLRSGRRRPEGRPECEYLSE